MKKIINKYYKDFPICYKSYEVIGNDIILTFVNLEKGIINTIYVDYLQKEYEFEVQSDQSIVECKITNINPNLIGIINFKGVKYNNKFYNIKDYKNDNGYKKPKPINVLGRERFLYKNEFSKANKYPKKNIVYMPSSNENYWSCVCGCVNFGADKCESCGIEKEKVFSVKSDYGKIVPQTEEKINISINALIYCVLIISLSFLIQGFLGDFVFENQAKNNLLGIINRFVCPLMICILTSINIYSLSKYNLILEKVTHISRTSLILYLNGYSMLYTINSTYNIMVIIGIDIVFFLSYLIYFIKSKKEFNFKIFYPVISLVMLIVFASKTIYYSDYNLKVVSDGILYYVEIEEDITEYTIPNKIDMMKVTEVSFMNDIAYKIEKLYIPKNTRKIHKYSNATLPMLKEIILDEKNNNYYLKDGILYTKSNKVEYVPSSVKTVYVDDVIVEKETFKEALGLEILYIGPNVEKIEFGAFSGCVNLYKIDFSNNEKLKEIGTNAFMNTGLVDVYLPKNITTLGKGIFEGCKKIKSLNAPFIGLERETDPNDYLAQDLFVLYFGTSSYMFGELIPESLKFVEIYDIDLIHNVTFYNAKYIENIVLPEKLYFIGKNSFYGCESLKEFQIPSKVTDIKEGCFENCVSLEKIFIPKSVTKIDKNAFKNCISLKEVIYEGDVKNLIIEGGNEYLTSVLFN